MGDKLKLPKRESPVGIARVGMSGKWLVSSATISVTIRVWGCNLHC